MVKGEVNSLCIFKMHNGALGWVEFGPQLLIIRKKDWGIIHTSTNYHTVMDHSGAEKLSNTTKMLEFAVRRISDPAVTSVDDLHQVWLEKGEYFPRIWRGYNGGRPFVDNFDLLNPFAVYGGEINGSVVAAESLLMEVKELFRSVEPHVDNDASYGHRMRELLILLCTEVEANLVSVLKQNFPIMVENAKGYLKTKHYQVLRDVMFLDKYVVGLADYKDRRFSPFQNWVGPDRSTESIPWYAAYNSVKHDRETNFSCASMSNVLNAAAALHILQIAQWGGGLFHLLGSGRKSIYEIDEQPRIPLGEIYVPQTSATDDRRIPSSQNVFDRPLPYEQFIDRQFSAISGK